MLRQRLVRQSAVNISSSNESTNMTSTPPMRRRRSSQDTMYRQLSSDSLDNLLATSSSTSNEGRRGGGRRHSVACSVLHMDMQKPSFKTAFNTAVRRMSDACSMLSSAPSSTYNLSSIAQMQPPKKKGNEVMLPQVLGTFRQSHKPPMNDKNSTRNNFQVNRRFSTDCPPPSYTDVTSDLKQSATRQKQLTRQHQVVTTRASLVAVEDDDFPN